MEGKKQAILEIRHMQISFQQYQSRWKKASFSVIQDLSLEIRSGEILAVIGASGSGKSLLAHGIMGILPYNAKMQGEILYCGEPWTEKKRDKLRGKAVVLIPQSVSYLDPLLKVGKQLRGKRDSAEVLSRYGLPPETEQLYPFQLSGGMARRVLISTAVIERPRLVIADEPTPGLSASTAKMVLGHLREIAEEGAGVLLITHDFALAAEFADRIVVLYGGTAVEEASASDFGQITSLRHPYTKDLWRALPKNGFQANPGAQPSYTETQLSGCLYQTRCTCVQPACRKEPIPWQAWQGGFVRCLGVNRGQNGGGGG